MAEPTFPQHLIRANGGAIPISRLQAAGVTVGELRSALSAGMLRRVRKGWVALPDAPYDVVRAVRVGGSLTGSSVARLHGLWLLEDDVLHVRVRPTASRLRSPDDSKSSLDRQAHGVCVHYRDDPSGRRRAARDGLALSIAEMFRCSGAVPGMVALESALNRGELQMGVIESLRDILPAWAGRYLDDASPDSDSGLETIARMLVRRLRVPVRVQVVMRGVRRVDLLIGDRLVLELDGREFHSGDAFDRDRMQDLELSLRGYLVVRLSYRMVMEDWDATHRAVQELVRRGLHRWRSVARELPAFAVPDAGNQAPSPLWAGDRA